MANEKTKSIEKATSVKKAATKKPEPKKAAPVKSIPTKTVAKKPAIQKYVPAPPAPKLARRIVKPGKIYFEIDGKQFSYKALQKKFAEHNGDVYVVINKKKVHDEDGNIIKLL